MTSLCVMPLSMTFVKTRPPSPSRLAAWMLFWQFSFFLLFIHHGKFSLQTQRRVQHHVWLLCLVSLNCWILLIYNKCFSIKRTFLYKQTVNHQKCSMFDGWLTGCKELWTNYPRTWNMVVCFCFVIMGDSTCHNSDLRRVSILHKLPAHTDPIYDASFVVY